jgi:glycosyltransferase involved in cell wall biosynthesis
MIPLNVRQIDNNAWTAARPRLSVAIPFFRYDPRPLLARLDQEAEWAHGAIEILALDDGGGDPLLAEQVTAFIEAMATPARLIVLAANEGRAKGRNRLVQAARARHILLIDCDMAPDAPDFLNRYLELADEDVAAAFGGFTIDSADPSPQYALHRALQQRAECLPAHIRKLTPEKYVYTSNLLVRREVFDAEAFDEGFTGWGWEDVEWGMRVAARFGVLQIENTATHLGLDTPEVLAGKYESSVGNFARVAARHPQIVSGYPSYRLASALKRLPLRPIWRALLKGWAMLPHAPLLSRIVAMKVYRAALYADVV